MGVQASMYIYPDLQAYVDLFVFSSADIFNGEYGSENENKLEAMFDSLMDTKQRVSVANYKWTSARVLLHHAVSQLAYAVQKWKDLDKIPMQ